MFFPGCDESGMNLPCISFSKQCKHWMSAILECLRASAVMKVTRMCHENVKTVWVPQFRWTRDGCGNRSEEKPKRYPCSAGRHEVPWRQHERGMILIRKWYEDATLNCNDFEDFAPAGDVKMPWKCGLFFIFITKKMCNFFHRFLFDPKKGLQRTPKRRDENGEIHKSKQQCKNNTASRTLTE